MFAIFLTLEPTAQRTGPKARGAVRDLVCLDNARRTSLNLATTARDAWPPPSDDPQHLSEVIPETITRTPRRETHSDLVDLDK